MQTAANLDPDTERAARAFLKQIEGHYHLVRAILFGSRARQDHRRDSDVDVAVLLGGTPEPFLATKLNMADIAYDVLLETGIRVQPFPIWETEWAHPESYPNPRLLRNIEREGIAL